MRQLTLRVVVLALTFLFTNSQTWGGRFVFTKIADRGTQMPGSFENFVGFGGPSIDGGNLSFEGIGVGGERGIYSYFDGSLARIADSTTPLPGGAGTSSVAD